MYGRPLGRTPCAHYTHACVLCACVVLQEALKSGVVLCNLVNALSPGKIARVNKQNMAFKQMENIAAFIDAVKTMGVPDHENFLTVDLYEGKNMRQVYLCVMSLKRATGHGFERSSRDAPALITDMPDVRAAASQAAAPPPESTSAQGIDPSVKRQQVEAFEMRDVARLGGARRAGEVDTILEARGLASNCPVCNLVVTSGAVNACNEVWHPKCFCCKKCGKNIARAKFYEHENKPYCDRCIFLVR